MRYTLRDGRTRYLKANEFGFLFEGQEMSYLRRINNQRSLLGAYKVRSHLCDPVNTGRDSDRGIDRTEFVLEI